MISPGKSLRLVTSSMEQKARREFFDVEDSIHGRQVVELMDEQDDYPIEPNDIILSVGGHKIDDDGNSQVDGLSIPMTGLARLFAKNDQVDMEIWRKGETIEITVPSYPKRAKVNPGTEGSQDRILFIWTNRVHCRIK